MWLITSENMKAVAREMLTRPNGWKAQLSAESERRQWRCFFGTDPLVAAHVWNRIDPLNEVDPYAKPQHLLYALFLLKKYAGDEPSGMAVNTSKNNFPKWAWIFVREIHDLHPFVVSHFVVIFLFSLVGLVFNFETLTK